MLSILKKLIDPCALHTALRNKNEKRALELIKEKFQINYIDSGYNPLQLSLIYKMYRCTIELLLINIDPNSYFEGDENKKTIQPHILGEDVSNIKLLALYGADIKDVLFNENNKYLKELINKMHLVFQERKNLERSFSREVSSKEKISICKKLSTLWSRAAEDEKNSIYKDFYLAKSKGYNDTIQELNSTYSTEPNTPETSYNQKANVQTDDENSPLLSNKLKVQ